MNPIDRQTKIVNIVRKHSRVAVDELAKSLHTSKETIRRDLTELARIGKVQKFHGGASLPITSGEDLFHQRMGQNTGEKVLIASEAVKLFSPGETILIDTGSTTFFFAEKLTEISNLTVVTNSVEIAKIISQSHSSNSTFLLGGEFSNDNRQTIGSMAISQIRSFRAHHTVLTVGAVDARTGIMDFNIEEAQVARSMIEQSESITILADSSKLEKIASFKVCSLDRVTNLVCDKVPSEKMQKSLKQANVNVFAAEQ